MNKKSICLTLSEEDYNNLQKISEVRGQNIQSTLRAFISINKNLKPTYDKETGALMLTELMRIGNNFNQIAKHLNSGFRSGWHDSFEHCADDLRKLKESIYKHVRN